MYGKLISVISASGIWDGTREQTHKFLLSPSVYTITGAQSELLSRLGFALRDCLYGLSHMATIAYDSQHNYRGAWPTVRKVFSTGVPKAYIQMQGLNSRHIPSLLKVDLMVDEQGNFWIAEIDGHNKHGLGYSTLARRFREATNPDAKALPGSVRLLAQRVLQLGHTTIKLFYADQERFYLPEFIIAQQEFAKYGVECLVVSEMEATAEFLSTGMFLDLPFLYKRIDLYQHIISAYKAGAVHFVIPPKPFLGAKGVLALLRNDARDSVLEGLLETFIRKQSLQRVRECIPETHLVGKMAEGMSFVAEKVSHRRYVLKESISSGMKGTVFSDGADFDAELVRACNTNMNWVLQAEIANQPQTFSWYELLEGQPVLRTASDWFMRTTVQYVHGALADIIVTARRDKAVHGAKDCIQIGTIVL